MHQRGIVAIFNANAFVWVVLECHSYHSVEVCIKKHKSQHISLFHPNADGKLIGQLSISPDRSCCTAMESFKDANYFFWQAEGFRQNFPESVSVDCVVGLLEINEAEMNGLLKFLCPLHQDLRCIYLVAATSIRPKTTLVFTQLFFYDVLHFV